ACGGEGRVWGEGGGGWGVGWWLGRAPAGPRPPPAPKRGSLPPPGLWFTRSKNLPGPPEDTRESSPASAGTGAVARPAAEHKSARPTATVAAAPKPANPPAGSSDDGPDKPAGGGEVVRLDRFRKK